MWLFVVVLPKDQTISLNAVLPKLDLVFLPFRTAVLPLQVASLFLAWRQSEPRRTSSAGTGRTSPLWPTQFVLPQVAFAQTSFKGPLSRVQSH